ncbi:glycogen debranching N-terminal domain-containing protein [Streptomyces sp. NPDC015127]|uniref:glycogen debranching N-terminal domain-containing protein n=1 Tax=Streptomyces sp. NPDC015127 TaxID=3364939 RepID=UPI0036F7EEB6
MQQLSDVSGRRGRPPMAPSAPSRPSPPPGQLPGGGLQSSSPARRPDLPPVHDAIMCVALPCLAVSPQHGQLCGNGIEGVYRSGRRLLSRCRLRVHGREPLLLQGRLVSADLAEFIAVVRTPSESGPDPDVVVERSRDAQGTERITLRSTTARTLRLPIEIVLGTDLAELGAIAAGRPGPELPATVHDAGLRWAAGRDGTGPGATVTADPAPHDALASAGVLRWELEVPPGGSRTIELRVRARAAHRGTELAPGISRPATRALVPAPELECDDPRTAALVATAVADLRALLDRDPAHPADASPAAGVPWRCRPAPAEALWAARMVLPLTTRLAATTLRIVARTQRTGTSPDFGHIPGPLRDAGPHLPASCTGTEATLAFPSVVAEAWRWGLPERDLAELLPAMERCLQWLRRAAGEQVLLAEPGTPGFHRTETQAHAHRAALLGADVLEATGCQGAAYWRDWAEQLRQRFREDFWLDDPGGGRPVAGRLPGGRPVPHLGAGAAHLLDTGLLGGGRHVAGLLDKAQTEQLARLFAGPALHSGWGLRSLGAKERGHNPFGHRSGAVRIHETVVAVAGLAAAGFEREASSLIRGVLDASDHFGHRLPEMLAGVQRGADSVPVPHPAACRPAALAAAASVQLALVPAGIRPDVPRRTVALHPMRSAPLGALRIAGLSVAGEPFAVRVSRLGLGMVEEAAQGLQLGV